MDTAVLTLGVASTTTGSIVLPNAGNANTVTLQSGTTSGSYTLTLPTAVASAGQVLTDAAGNGVLSWTTAGFAWGASIASTSGTGVTATISNSSSASTVAYSGVIGDTQTNVCTVAQLNTGASSVGHKGMLITCANASGNAIGLEISTSTTGTGRGLYVHSTGTQSNAPLVQIVNAGSGAVTGNSVLLDVAANNGFNPSSGNESHAIEVAGQLANVYNM